MFVKLFAGRSSEHRNDAILGSEFTEQSGPSGDIVRCHLSRVAATLRYCSLVTLGTQPALLATENPAAMLYK